MFTALACVANLARGQAPTPQGLVEAMHLENYTLQYENEQGQAISAEEFMRTIAGGKSFKVEKDASKKTATLVLGGSPATHGLSKLTFAAGDKMPAITGTDPGNQPITLQSGAGKYTILSFYFSECVPCIEEIPDLNAFARAHPDVRMVAVTFDPAAETAKFVKAHGLELQTVSDAKDFVSKAGIKAYPTLVLADPAGRFVAARTGGIIDSKDKSSGYKNLERWFTQYAKRN
jgi:peroxiredoxin